MKLARATDRILADRWLSPAERRACAALGDPMRQRDWRAGRIAAKRAAARLAGIRPFSRLELLPVPGRGPRLVVHDACGRRRPAALNVSVAHRDGRAVAAAVAPPLRVGVDLERVGTVRAEQARYFLTRAEQALAAARDRAELWALKEAAWKALGVDALTPFTKLELHFDDRDALRGVRLWGRFVAARASVRHPWPGYVAAVVSIPEADS